ncbi:MAG: hypothetical protein ABR981_02210 [Candidatus Micrarchaeaceae archaeon]|jgi:peptidoglycan hydrolase CwlO-like protein
MTDNSKDFIKRETKIVYKMASHHKAFLLLMVGLLVIASATAYSYNVKYKSSQQTLHNTQFTESQLSSQYASSVSSLQANNTNLKNQLYTSENSSQNLQEQVTQLQSQVAGLEAQNAALSHQMATLEGQLQKDQGSSLKGS